MRSDIKSGVADEAIHESMSQEQLNKLLEDAEELMMFDDLTEVYIFIKYLAEKYHLKDPKTI